MNETVKLPARFNMYLFKLKKVMQEIRQYVMCAMISEKKSLYAKTVIQEIRQYVMCAMISEKSPFMLKLKAHLYSNKQCFSIKYICEMQLSIVTSF